ncbi:MAG: hypothetical protein QM493_04665 [Sulfurovum sp.]
MKIMKLSLIASLAISASFAGGDIELPPAPLPPVENDTTIAGKLQAYYMTHDNGGTGTLFDALNTTAGSAVTLDVSHKFYDGISANFSAVGFANAGDSIADTANTLGKLEGVQSGAFINVANITASYWDTTLVAGRQLINTPMISGFNWLLAPGAFEAYTLMNNSIENLTIVGSYLAQWRANNAGNGWRDLTTFGDNWTVGAVYKNDDLFDTSIWYYNVDAGSATSPDKYTQIYADAGISYMGVRLDGQYVITDYNTVTDGSAFGAKLSYTLYDVALSAAFVQIVDNNAGYVGVDGLYTSSWNTFASTTFQTGDSSTYKVAASTSVYGVDMEASFAGYGDDGQEIDVIVGYGITDSINFDAIYSSTTSNTAGATATDAIEFIATYKF